MRDESLLQLAIEHHRSGQWQDAETEYRRVLQADPNYPDALHLFGLLLGKLCRHDEAIAHVLRAVDLCPQVPEYCNGLGNVLLHAGQIDDAIKAFERALALRPDYADALSNLGNAQKAAGRFTEALAAHQRAAWLSPDSPEVQNNLGVSLRLNGRLDEAVAAFQKAIALKPDYAEPYNNLGTVLRNLDRPDDAIAAYEKALQLRPDLAEAWTNLGNVQRDIGLLDEAIASHTQSIRLRPTHANSFSNLAVALTAAGRLTDAIAALRRATDLRPDGADLHSNLIYTLHFLPEIDSKELLRSHREWAARFAGGLQPPPQLAHTSDRRIKIGYVSPDLRLHPVGRFLLPLLSSLDRTQFELFCYADVRRPDVFTERLQSQVDRWQSTLGLSDEQLAAQIRSDGIDLLVDLSMHMADNRLLVFARKPAPVQITWLAYTGTTGLAAIDYRISDPHLDPPGEDLPYVEETLRLPRCFWCYEPPDSAPPINPLPALGASQITFGCLNNFCKVTAPTLRLWAQLLASIPRSRLILHTHTGSHRQAIQAVFTAAGVHLDRIEFVGFHPLDDFLRLHHRIDICLDPFPYTGGTTTCDALWMGCPVVSLAGRTAVGRAGVSILSNVGLAQLIARTSDQYLSIARVLAADLTGLANLRSTMRERMLASPLMDAARFAADMSAAYRHAIQGATFSTKSA